ncbi:unnamed protein product [Allacma fusca]|uniref:Uncharacterized protein n=1 Tax=Allacma fusca TaxID=39272 RepID=A0A8J2LHF1_9HEXA|nr:unnamed protein product [Allacma fusca]
MGKFALEIACSTEYVKQFAAEGEDFRYYLKIKCSQCGDVSERFLYVCAAVTVPTKTGRSTANLVGKCKNCSREWTLNILPESIVPFKAEEEAKGDGYQAIAVFEVRGCEPAEFEPRKGWKVASSESNATFSDVDLSEGDWADYDDRASVSLAIMELTSRFTKR